ncbi:MAG TPA: efflux RND transporter periplasmic adaptor subunit [Patescibacteria group bacterium]|nr:efflux RND transporter periplasmic adaptor subunit [Patescibacteria group bacterium]
MIKWFLGIKKKLGKKFWIILALMLLIVGYKMYSAQKNLPQYSVTIASKGDLLETLSTTGRVKADEYATLGFQSGGRIKWVGVKKGDKVWKGQAIASLDTVILNASYQQALNNYRNYQAQAQNILDSVKDHAGDETFAQKATRTAAEVARDNSYDAMLAARQNLSYAVIYSPFAGIVAEASPSFPGINVGPTSASYVVVNPQSTYFESEIAETDLPKVKVGQKIKLKLDAYPEETIDGQIQTIGIVAFTSSTGGNSYSLRIQMPENKDLKYKVGMEGDVEIILETLNNVLKVPTTAIVNEEDINYVWIFENGKVKKVKVEIGGNSDEETEIKSGITEGTKVITEPSNKFKDGQKVRI